LRANPIESKRKKKKQPEERIKIRKHQFRERKKKASKPNEPFKTGLIFKSCNS
jgi:hypothetical protein